MSENNEHVEEEKPKPVFFPDELEVFFKWERFQDLAIIKGVLSSYNVPFFEIKEFEENYDKIKRSTLVWKLLERNSLTKILSIAQKFNVLSATLHQLIKIAIIEEKTITVVNNFSEYLNDHFVREGLKFLKNEKIEGEFTFTAEGFHHNDATDAYPYSENPHPSGEAFLYVYGIFPHKDPEKPFVLQRKIVLDYQYPPAAIFQKISDSDSAGYESIPWGVQDRIKKTEQIYESKHIGDALDIDIEGFLRDFKKALLDPSFDVRALPNVVFKEK